MELLFLGVGPGLGSADDIYQSNMVLTCPTGKKLLIDCGTDIRFSLAKAHLTHDDIEGVYISHLHSDHVGGLERFAFLRKFSSTRKKPDLIVHEALKTRLWEHSLSGAMETLGEEEATLECFFNVITLKDKACLSWQEVNISLIQTVHMISNKILQPSYGLTLTHEKNQYYITTDTQFVPERYMAQYQKAKLIFHDCEILDKPSTVHSHYNDLKTLPSDIKAKMWLYHYNDGPLPDAKGDGFGGFVQQGQVFQL